jgi:hypothetical protein
MSYCEPENQYLEVAPRGVETSAISQLRRSRSLDPLQKQTDNFPLPFIRGEGQGEGLLVGVRVWLPFGEAFLGTKLFPLRPNQFITHEGHLFAVRRP